VGEKASPRNGRENFLLCFIAANLEEKKYKNAALRPQKFQTAK